MADKATRGRLLCESLKATIVARFWIAALLSTIVFSGCGNIVMQSQTIVWPALSKQGCPDLNGRYAAGLYAYVTAIVDLDQPDAGRISTTGYARQTIPNPYWRQIASDDAATVVRHSSNLLALVLQDGKGREAARTDIRLDTQMSGCRDGVLVLRSERRIRGVEGSGASLDWSEFDIRRTNNGSVSFTGRGARQVFGGFMGIPGGDWHLPSDLVPSVRGETFSQKETPSSPWR
jgi:hypothetical protein